MRGRSDAMAAVRTGRRRRTRGGGMRFFFLHLFYLSSACHAWGFAVFMWAAEAWAGGTQGGGQTLSGARAWDRWLTRRDVGNDVGRPVDHVMNYVRTSCSLEAQDWRSVDFSSVKKVSDKNTTLDHDKNRKAQI